MKGFVDFTVSASIWAGLVAMGAMVLIALPLMAPRRTRSGGAGLGIASLALLLLVIWFYCLGEIYYHWGETASIVSILIAGVGVYFAGIGAALAVGDWNAILTTAVLFAVVACGGWICYRAKESIGE